MRIRLCGFADEASAFLDTQIRALQENNISLIELRNINGKNIKDVTLEEAENYAARLEETGIEVWAIGSPLGKIGIEDDFDHHLEEARHIFRLAKIFNTKRIRIFSFFLKDYNKYEELVIRRLERLLEEAKKHGMMLFHENEKDIYGDRVERVLKLKTALPDLRLVFDPANYLQCREDINEAIEKLHNKTDYFHIKDVVKATGEIVPAGYGDGKIEEIVNRLEKETVLTLEPHLAIFSGYEKIDSTNLRTKFRFSTNEEAFDFAVISIKQILMKCGYQEKEGYWVK